MTVEVLFFARLRELAGRDREALSLSEGATVADALAEIRRRFPALEKPLESCRVAMNEEFTPAHTPLVPSAVLALIPPVSGG